MEYAIQVEGLSKKFYRSRGDRPWTFQELVSRGWKKSLRKEPFWALNQVSFKQSPGRMTGIIGRNGAGKSTLLRLIGGVIKPDQGQIITHGRIGALIDLGAGFHPDLTGRENVFINGVISGLTRKEVVQNFDSIVAFAELEDFIDSPLRIYSLGMQMRLAFSVATHIHPDILLIDEVLSVGDIGFQKKCLERIAQFKEQGCTTILVSHDAGLVSKLCDDVIWLEEGSTAAQGEAQKVVHEYMVEMAAETRRRTPRSIAVSTTPAGVDLTLNENRFGSQEIQIEAVSLFNKYGEAIRAINSGEGLTISIDYNSPQPIASPIFGVTITREDRLVCWEGSTQAQHPPAVNLQGRGRVILTLERLDLAQGQYFIDVGVYHKDWAYAYDYHWHVYTIEVLSDRDQKGVLLPPHRWSFEEKS
jgi:homopolymeric O-antigen transport system ATP-binding protein